MRRSNTDLLLVSAFALLAALVSAAVEGGASAGGAQLVRGALSVPFVLFLPGYALSAALLPDNRSGLAERIALSAGLSIATAALGGLLLDRLPSGLTAPAWRVLLLGVTLVAAGYAFWRRETRGAPGPGRIVWPVSLREAALVSAAALLIGLALGLSAIGLSPTSSRAIENASAGGAGFTQFWVLPSQDAATQGDQRTVRVGLHNYEGAAETYRVTLQAGGNVIAQWSQVTIESGDSWQVDVSVPAGLARQDLTAEAYRAGSATPYRRVRVAAAAEDGSG